MTDPTFYLMTQLWRFVGIVEATNKDAAKEFMALLRTLPERECEDCISREGAIAQIRQEFQLTLKQENPECVTYRKESLIRRMEALPRVSPAKQEKETR